METSGVAPLTDVYDCATCGACCREAFDTTPVEDTDVRTLAGASHLVRVHPDGWRDLVRVPSPDGWRGCGSGTRCGALTGDGGPAPFRCAIYADRPAACSELAVGGDGCTFARRRLGLPT